MLLDWIDGCRDCFYESADEYLDGLQFISDESVFGGTAVNESSSSFSSSSSFVSMVD